MIIKEKVYRNSIYKLCSSVFLFICLFVCLYPINIQTAEPIGPNFFVVPHMIPGKVYGWLEFKQIDKKSQQLKVKDWHEAHGKSSLSIFWLISFPEKILYLTPHFPLPPLAISWF